MNKPNWNGQTDRQTDRPKQRKRKGQDMTEVIPAGRQIKRKRIA